MLAVNMGVQAQHTHISRYQALLLTPSHCTCQHSAMIRSSWMAHLCHTLDIRPHHTTHHTTTFEHLPTGDFDGQAKVTQSDASFAIQQDVVWFDVPTCNTVLLAVVNGTHHVCEDAVGLLLLQTAYLLNVIHQISPAV